MTTAFQTGVRKALADPALQEALDCNAERRRAGWEAAFALLPESGAVRQRAAEIRRRTIAELDAHLETFTAQLRRHGVLVHRAADGAEACRAVLSLLQSHGVRKVVKAKSMVTEEIGLNPVLTAAGIEVVETDLGEFIVQLRGEPPAHITAPAIHLRREDVGRTLEQHLGLPFTTEVAEMTAAVRQAMRLRFFEAEAGISGVNFGVAETGTLCLVTNEGNGRMVTSLPPLHIAVMGTERLVPSLADLSVMLEVLPRAGTGQARTSYISLLQGPRGPGDPDGPLERHVVLVDNGRSAVRESAMAEALACIRCGACLNACPVYQEIGGHAYGSVYPGPIGSVISPALWGVARFGHLARASTLCGACRDACPVDIDLPALLLRLRAEDARRGRPSVWLRAGLRLFAWAIVSPGRYRWAQRLAAAAGVVVPQTGGWIRRLPPPLKGWTDARDFPPFARRPFHERWTATQAPAAPWPIPPIPPVGEGSTGGRATRETHRAGDAPPGDADAIRCTFIDAVEHVGGEIIESRRESIALKVSEFLRREGVAELLSWSGGPPLLDGVIERLRADGVRVIEPEVPSRSATDRGPSLGAYVVPAGLTGAVAGLADAGTLVLPGGPGRPQLASLLPPLHLALLDAAEIHVSLEAWLLNGARGWLPSSSGVVLVTGPSRTADIEMTLTIGVHGPSRVVVFLVDGDHRRSAVSDQPSAVLPP